LNSVHSEDPLNITDKAVILERISEITRGNYFEDIDMNLLYDGAIQGMIEKLDPHSSYMAPTTADDFMERINGNFEGIGITFSIINEKITVIDTIPGGPSEKAGLKSRDKIVNIDGQDAIGIDIDEVKNRLRGPQNSKVEVQVERPGEKKALTITITRASVELNSVSHSYMINDTVGYIGITRFTRNTQFDVKTALEELESRNMGRLILDLRNNTGGSLDAAIGVVNLFINEGEIVSTKGKKHDSTWDADESAKFTRMPIIVLINHGSASASEIVAGALQDHDRALIVGQTSFGKGLVMDIYNLRNENKDIGKLILTIANYYTPSGRLIQRPYSGSREDYIKEGFDDFDPNAADVDKKDRPVFHTDLGREVYGGGGITPDKIIISDNRINKLEIRMKQANLFFEFADDYLTRNDNVPEDFNAFLLNYTIDEKEYGIFKEFAIEKEIEIENKSEFREELSELLAKHDIPEENIAKVEETLVENNIDLDEILFNKSKEFIEREIKMQIARMTWGTNEYYKVWHNNDTELISALSYFIEAEELLRNRLALGNL
ncbi:S41 family peptidase, partial [Candidatus Latescibacterota bacterium]